MENSRILRRYTDITSLIDVLIHKRLVLLDPQTWDDKNDSYFMSVYKNRKLLKSLSALCFTTAAETYHHWRVFSGTSSGVCIVFLNESLSQGLIGKEGIRSGLVDYPTLMHLKNSSPPSLEMLPFTKRYPFRDEKEFRIIYESNSVSTPNYQLDISISDIDRVVLSPWIHPSLVNGIRNLLKGILGCEKLKVARSTLINNENWKKYADYNEQQAAH